MIDLFRKNIKIYDENYHKKYDVEFKNDDDLKLKEIDQLHSAVSEFSKKCFETKKFFITTLMAITTFMLDVKSNKSISIQYLLIVLFTIVLFWTLDAQAYYYQEKLRIKMNHIANIIRLERGLKEEHGFGIKMKKKRLENSCILKKILRSLFNSSQYVYIILFLIDIIMIIKYV